MVKYFLFLCFLYSPVAHLAYAAGPGPDEAIYTGDISIANNNAFFHAIGAKKIKRLLITSLGGEVEAGIELGRWVFAQKLDVVVSAYCLSSCANYVFTAAVKKIIKPGAVVAWHGNYHHLKQTGGWRDDIIKRMQRYHESEQQAERFVKNQLDHLVHLEKGFFSMIAVDESLCWIGKMAPFNVTDYYFLSVEDMARFGVRQVQAPVDYVKTDVRGLSSSVVYIKLPGIK